jgi:DeoR/GlpR family transcriptional regulator of sugar metabolism
VYAAERQQAMTQLVRERGRISVVELASQYDVTTETVRRDLSSSRTATWSAASTGAPYPPTH